MEAVNEHLVRNFLSTHSKTPKELLYLETSTIPIRFILKARRLGYFHHILTRDSSELINRVYCAQKRRPVKDDWYLTVQKDLADLHIDLSDDQIKNMTKIQFKLYLKKIVSDAAFSDLLKIKDSHSKGSDIVYSKFELQPYLKSNLLNSNEKFLLFKLRSRMTPVKSNFKSMFVDINCMLCGSDVPQSDLHLLECSKIIENCPTLNEDNETEYLDIFSNLEQQIRATKVYSAIFETKEKLEELF